VGEVIGPKVKGITLSILIKEREIAMNKTTNRTTGKVKISDKGYQALAVLALITVFIVASIMTVDFQPNDSSPSSMASASYTIVHDSVNHVSQER
jgi:hypothetical protein